MNKKIYLIIGGAVLIGMIGFYVLVRPKTTTPVTTVTTTTTPSPANTGIVDTTSGKVAPSKLSDWKTIKEDDATAIFPGNPERIDQTNQSPNKEKWIIYSYTDNNTIYELGMVTLPQSTVSLGSDQILEGSTQEISNTFGAFSTNEKTFHGGYPAIEVSMKNEQGLYIFSQNILANNTLYTISTGSKLNDKTKFEDFINGLVLP